jgi:hypothetical protein
MKATYRTNTDTVKAAGKWWSSGQAQFIVAAFS